MSIQNAIGIISSCLNNKSGTPSGSGTRSFTNGTPDNISASSSSGSLGLSPGTGGTAGIAPDTTAWTFTGSPSGSVRIVVFDAAKLQALTYVSWMPICNPTNMCGGSKTFVSGGTVRTITYFGDQFTIYKLNSGGVFALVTPSLITDATLGKYWQFTATSNDFVVVSNGANQYQLKFKDDGFYYFQDMTNCASTPVVLGNPVVTTIPPVITTTTTTAIKLTTTIPPKITTIAPTTIATTLVTTTKTSTTISTASTTTTLTSSNVLNLVKSTTTIVKSSSLQKPPVLSTTDSPKTSTLALSDDISSTQSILVRSSTVVLPSKKLVSTKADQHQQSSYLGNLDIFRMPQITVAMFVRVFISLDLLVFLMVKLSNLIRKRRALNSNDSHRSSQRTQGF